jgi:hypothetical protein
LALLGANFLPAEGVRIEPYQTFALALLVFSSFTVETRNLHGFCYALFFPAFLP